MIRLRGLLTSDEHRDPCLRENLVLLPMAGESCALVTKGQTTRLFNELQKISEGARLITIDPLRRMHDGDENDSNSMTEFVIAMERLAISTGAAVLGLHHANRASSGDSASQNASRGSSALVDAARWQVSLSRMDEYSAKSMGIPEAMRLRYVAVDFAKTNYLPPRSRTWLERSQGGRLSNVQLSPSVPKGRVVGGARLLNS